MNAAGLTTQATGPVFVPAATPPAVAGNARSDDALLKRAAGEPDAAERVTNKEKQDLRAQQNKEPEYSKEDLAKLQELRARDREVRSHELAHLAAAGGHARGGPSYTYQSGPDGRRYAVAGEVNIDTSPVSGDPAATIAKANQIRRAALAPADPSAQDRRVATQATAMAAKARSDMAKQQHDIGAGSESLYSTESNTQFIDEVA